MKLKFKENVSHETFDVRYEEWLEYGRIRKCAKAVDCYSVLVERGWSLYIYLSTGQEVKADKFKGLKDEAIIGWLTVLYTIGRDRKHG